MRGKLHQLKVRLMLKGVCQRGEKALCVIPVPCTYPRRLVRAALVDKKSFSRVG